MKEFLCAFCVAFGLLAGNASADERILAFHSEIQVLADGSMDVTETIRVRAEGNQIRHGIYRDFPTGYRDRLNNRVHVDFEPRHLERDGATEPFHTEGQSNGTRIYFGAKDTNVDPGEHTYTFDYHTTRQLGFFADHDELYWNATGNGWDFAIDAASANVTLPGAVAPEQMHVEAYTGAQGEKGKAWNASADSPSHAAFVATRTLPPRNGLTIVVGFPKGIVAAPTDAMRVRWFLRDNGGVLVGAIGLALMWGYYLFQWLRVGRDPKRGVIIPLYEPPADLSPGTLRHIERMGYDDRCFAADLVDLAVRGALEISQTSGDYTLRKRSGGGTGWPATEGALLAGMLGARQTLSLKQSEHVTISAARSAHKQALEQNDIGLYFKTNGKLVVPGVLIGIAALVLGLLAHGAAPAAGGAAFILVWLAGWSVGVIALLTATVRAWRAPPGIVAYGGAVFMTLFSLPFVAGELFGIGVLASFTGIAFTIVAAALVLTNVVFFQWLKAPTIAGRKILDQIAGLRLYLGVAEREQLAAQKEPPMNVDEFQRFLPYALALGVEKTWADRFAAAVGPAAAAAAASAIGWYQGGTISNVANFTDSLGSSLSSTISSSSSAPGSSSGSGGGGSSGGGGGGGGGGGW
ncbi:MAG: DUF2207 domain-containing protein [Dokdonella sp.]|uniref:DUF2207 domain-containing protein n=1 Tax=Dokdonella sp. TaxID=2291710 RepID=UPI0032661B91